MRTSDGSCLELDDTFAGSLDGLAPWSTSLGDEYGPSGDWDDTGGCSPPAVSFRVLADQRDADGHAHVR